MKIKMIKFYKRGHQQEFPSVEAAKAHIEASRLKGNAEMYIELWKMENECDGEQLGVYDADGNELVLHKPLEAIRKSTARLMRR